MKSLHSLRGLLPYLDWPMLHFSSSFSKLLICTRRHAQRKKSKTLPHFIKFSLYDSHTGALAFPHHWHCCSTQISPLILPVGRDCLDLCVEIHALFAVEVYISPNGSTAACETEEWKGYRDGNIDSYLPNINFVLEFSRWSSTLSKDSTAISIGVRIDQSNCFIQWICLKAHQRRTKYLLGISDVRCFNAR